MGPGTTTQLLARFLDTAFGHPGGPPGETRDHEGAYGALGTCSYM